MLMKVLLIALTSLNAWFAPSAKAEVDVISCGSVTFDTCSVNMLCFDDGYHKVTKCVNKPATWYRQNAKNKVFYTALSKKELIERGLIRNASVSGGVGHAQVTVRHGKSDTDTYVYRHSSRSSDPWNVLRVGCPELTGVVNEKREDLSSLRKQLVSAEKKLQEVKFKLSDCHKDCRNFAVKDSSNKCHFKKVKRVNDYKKVAKYLTGDDFKNPELAQFLADGQTNGKTLVQSDFKGSEGDICEKLLEDEGCAEFLLDENLGSCFEDEDYAAWRDKAKKVGDLKVRIAVLERDADINVCVISKTRLPNPDTYGDKSVACLELMAQTCFDELDRLFAEQNPDCVDCNMR